MADYTYSELMKMQDKAIERVRQMQEKARQTLEADPSYIPRKNEEEENEPEPSGDPEPVKAERVKNIPPTNNNAFPFGLNLNLDKDKATILPLLLLLMNEVADHLLLLALVYIMA